MTEPTRGGPRGATLAAAVTVLGVALSVLAAGGLRAVEQRAVDRTVERQAVVVGTAIVAGVRRYTDAARQVAASLGALRALDTTGFAAVTAPLAAAGLPGVTGLSVVVPGSAARKDWPTVSLDPVNGATDHFFTVLDRPLDGTLPRVGRDLAAAPETTAALTIARLSADVALSDAYARPPNLAVVAPITRARAFVGWVALGFRAPDFLAETLRDASPASPGVVGAILSAGAERLAAVSGNGETRAEHTVRLVVGGQTWELRVTTGPATGIDAHLDEAVLATGAGLSLVLGLLTWVIAAGRARDRARVAVAAAEVHRTERSARQQATLLQRVLTSIDEGVAVADEDGTIALLNPPAQATMAIPAPDGRPQYGVFRVDGATPYPGADQPLRRALSGTACADEFVIRTAARPDGVRVRVAAQPLDLEADRHGALAVSRDVTALRAHEADLTAFAGIAAHDLRAPLATALGHLDLAHDALPLDPASARAYLDRVRTGVERMRRLVDDLLTYAAIRDTDLDVADVDLDVLVTEVLAAVLPANRARAPHIVVRRLPPVRGDVRLLRSLLSGLLGHALKDTPPDETPRIAVRARPARSGDGAIRVEIADHGIGVPPGRHAYLFSPGNPGTGPYPESDLTLAICRRIVERHGGTIAATDNPGGGTVVRFTLPAANAAGTSVADSSDAVGTHLVGAAPG